MTDTLTEPQAKALAILKRYPGLSAGWFAKQMWAGRDSMSRSYRCGSKGSARGTVLNLTAGSWLVRLEKLGLVYYLSTRWSRDWYISSRGRELLAAYRSRK